MMIRQEPASSTYQKLGHCCILVSKTIVWAAESTMTCVTSQIPIPQRRICKMLEKTIKPGHPQVPVRCCLVPWPNSSHDWIFPPTLCDALPSLFSWLPIRYCPMFFSFPKLVQFAVPRVSVAEMSAQATRSSASALTFTLLLTLHFLLASGLVK